MKTDPAAPGVRPEPNLAMKLTSAMQHARRYHGQHMFTDQAAAERAYFRAVGESLARGREIARLSMRVHKLKQKARRSLADRPPVVGREEAQPEDWRTAALLMDRTRRAIRERHEAGEPVEVLAYDFGVPVAFIVALCAWQLCADGREEAQEPPKKEQFVIRCYFCDWTMGPFKSREATHSPENLAAVNAHLAECRVSAAMTLKVRAEAAEARCAHLEQQIETLKVSVSNQDRLYVMARERAETAERELADTRAIQSIPENTETIRLRQLIVKWREHAKPEGGWELWQPAVRQFADELEDVLRGDPPTAETTK